MHLLPLLLHVRHQLKLGAAPYQVLPGVVDVEVVVAVQIVGEEPDAALQGHELGAPGEILQLRLGKPALRPLQEAPDVAAVQLDIETDLAQILLVLGAVVGAEADGVAEVVDGKAGHGGVEIDDAHTFLGFFVNEDVVELGVVVGNPQGKLPFPQGVQGHGAVRLSVEDKLNFLLHLPGPSQLVRFQRRQEFGEPILGVVEVHNGLVEGLGGVVREKPLKPSKGPGGGFKQLRGGLLEAQGIFHILGQPPDPSGIVGVVGLALPGGNQVQGLPLHIPAGSEDFPAQVGGDPDEVFHQLLLPGEGRHGQALEDIADGLALLGLADQAEGVVDMAAAVANRPQQRGRKIKRRDDLGEHRLVFRNVHRLPPFGFPVARETVKSGFAG